MVRFAWVVLSVMLAACASAPSEAPSTPPPPNRPVIYLPPVAEMTLVTAAGLREHRPDWSDRAAINLSEALRLTVQEDRRNLSAAARSAAIAHAGRIRDLVEGDPGSSKNQRDATTPLEAVILVEYDVESSASRVVQGGLGLVFGGVPGPDGMIRRAHLVLFDIESGEAVWWHEAKAPDPREPKAARRLIEQLLEAIEGETGS